MHRRIRWAIYLVVLIGSLATWGLLVGNQLTEEGATTRSTGQRPELVRYYAGMDRLASLHAPLAEPKPGEWLAKYQEFGQTFEQYVAGRERPVCEVYSEIQVLPLGEFTPTQERLLQQTAEFMELFFGMPVRTLDRQPLDDVPAKAERLRDDGSRQLSTKYLLSQVLKPRRADDAAALLGLIADDLWPGDDWNYVFGQASLGERIGVWSLARFGDPEESEAANRLCLLRTMKTAAHETGHMLGIPHCIAYSCCMNGSNHLAEADRKPLEYCPECQAKLWWTCQIEPRARSTGLKGFAEKAGLTEEARYWKAAESRLAKIRLR